MQIFIWYFETRLTKSFFGTPKSNIVSNVECGWRMMDDGTEVDASKCWIDIYCRYQSIFTRRMISFLCEVQNRKFIIDWSRSRVKYEVTVDLQSLFGLLCTAVLIGWDPATPPPPPVFEFLKSLLMKRRHCHFRHD